MRCRRVRASCLHTGSVFIIPSRSQSTAGQAGARVEVEAVARDLGGMSAEEQRAAVMADAPELAALLADLQGCLAEVRGRVGPLLREVRPACPGAHEGCRP